MNGKIVKKEAKKECAVIERIDKRTVIYKGHRFEETHDLISFIADEKLKGLDYKGYNGFYGRMEWDYKGHRIQIEVTKNKIEYYNDGEEIAETVIRVISELKEKVDEIDKMYPQKIFICF